MLAGNMVDCENKIRVTVKRLKDEKKQTVLYGAGYCGRETLQLMQTHGIPVLAICDDFRVGEYLNTVKISDIRDIEIGEDTIIFITGGFNEKMKRNLYRLGLAAHYVDVDFGRYDPEKETRSYFLEHRAELERAYDLLTDKKSKQWFINLINYHMLLIQN